MRDDSCILTTKDFTILEIMRDRCLGRGDPLASILKRKIDAATVMFRDDVSHNVATLSSRVTFSVNGGEVDTRVLVAEPTASPVGMHLPLATRRGLALLGLTEGQIFSLNTAQGVEERIMLHKVHYQPESAKRKMGLEHEAAVRPKLRPALKLVRSGCRDGAHRPDDPGPSAA